MRRAWRLTSAAALVLAAASFLFSAYLYTRFESEAAQRRDQSCKQDERQEQTAVKRVVERYAYLRSLPREDYGTNLTRTIVRGLPDVESEARAAVAPPFCDERGVGLPELRSDPRMPRHRSFTRLLRKP